MDAPRTTNEPGRGGAGEVAFAFLRLGLVSFGGPAAHLGYFRKEFVERRRWLDDAAYADLVALCQFLPGPASSQVAFGLGLRRAGLTGALAAAAGFTLPSAAIMVLLGYGVAALTDVAHAGWLHGLRLAAAAVVAQAVLAMGRTLCPDLARRLLALCVAVLAVLLAGPALQVGVIAACALVGVWAFRDAGPRPAESPGAPGGHRWAAGSLVAYAVLLAGLPLLAGLTGSRPLAVFGGFYHAGALVFGGGHVVLPLLRAEVVPPGWISDERFLAGYGAAQALPGPLFSFAAYLGTVIHGAPRAWVGGLSALIALFLPGWLLVGGAYPFWHRLGVRGWARAALRGANAAVVGLLLAALYSPVCTESVRTLGDAAAALLGLLLLERFRVPAWALVAALAALGQWVLR